MHAPRLVITAALATVALALAPAAFAKTPTATYPDPSGDSKTAPDITQAVLTDTGSGAVQIEISLRTVQDLTGAEVQFQIDADRNSSTGSNGIDYVVFADETGASLAHWDGTQFASTDADLAPTLGGGKLGFTLKLADVGNVTTFNFFVGSFMGDDSDSLPDNQIATWPAKPVIRRVLYPATIVLGPKAGAVFKFSDSQVGYDLAPGSPETDITFTCSLTIAGKVVAPTRPGACSWKVPKKLKGKRAVVTLTFYSGDQILLRRSIRSKVH